MVAIGSKCLKYLVLVIFLICVLEAESGRNKNSKRRTNSGGKSTTSRSRHTTPRSHHVTTRRPHTTTRSHTVSTSSHHATNKTGKLKRRRHSTPKYEGHHYHTTPAYAHDIGFENVQHRVPGGGHQPQQGDTFHKTNFNHVAAVPPPPSNQGVGFENIQKNYQSIGFNDPQNANHGSRYQLDISTKTTGGYHPHPGSNVPVNASGGYHPQQGFVQHGHNVSLNADSGYRTQVSTRNSYMPHNTDDHPGNYHQSSGGDVYNPQPYYNLHLSLHNNAPPQIYQPVQQSSDSLLGHAGAFAGGYLIGKLTASESDSSDRKYEVHHFHHNPDGVPKHITVKKSRVVDCSKNDTQGLCVPNTFPICLSKGAIMCVTHLSYTVPCGTNATMTCVISALPCPDGNLTCNGTENDMQTVVYIPCISTVTVGKRNVLNNSTSSLPSNVSSDSVLSNANMKFCVTAIAKPKILKPPVESSVNLMVQMACLPFTGGLTITTIQNSTESSPVNTTTPFTASTGTSLSNVSIQNSTESSPLNTGTPFTASTGISLFNVSIQNSTESSPLNTSTPFTASTEISLFNVSIQNSTESSPVNTSTPFTASTETSLFNVSAFTETTTIKFFSETNLTETTQLLTSE